MMSRKVFVHIFILTLLTWRADTVLGQSGNLFIIGGGERPAELMSELVRVADLRQGDYIAVLTMASGVPEETFEALKKQLSNLCEQPAVAFHFSKEEATENSSAIDSVRRARLIYLSGGDQNRFMNVVAGSRLFDALHAAYQQGATIAGTSAGAAVMSEVMITGKEKGKESASFREVKTGSVVTAPGMAFLKNAVIDQHFIMRSRYNRLLSVLADHPDKMVVGIDESTALVVRNRKARVVGNSQVVVIAKPRRLRTLPGNRVAFKKARLSLLAAGDEFHIQ